MRNYDLGYLANQMQDFGRFTTTTAEKLKQTATEVLTATARYLLLCEKAMCVMASRENL